MQKIACLVPTYHRPNKIEPLIRNFFKCTTQADLYFIIDPKDEETRTAINSMLPHFPVKTFMIEGEYVKCINSAFKRTEEPFVFCGADDIEFTMDWDKKLLKSIEGYDITGGIDDWEISKSGIHTSHPMIRRSYINETGPSLGFPGLVYNPNRNHYHVDIEIEQLAWWRGVININKDCIIHHHHFVNKQAENDATYRHSREVFDADTKHYNETFKSKNYEYWDFTSMFQGKAVENPTRMKKLSVVMPIWNCEDYTRRTLASLIENTQHPYELIMIDDASTEHNGKELLAELKVIASKKFMKVTTVANPKQLYCNANWNKGVELATGDYIAIINSDIDFLTPDWDDYLMENIDLGYELVNPFQSDRVYGNKPYMKPPQEDAIYHLNIRGACFMISRALAAKAFPIPKRYVHWCGDNYISSKAATYLYDIRVNIFHYISKSGAKVDPKVFWTITRRDVKNWIEDTNCTDMDTVLHNCTKQLARAGGIV